MTKKSNQVQYSIVLGYILILLGISLPLYGCLNISYGNLTDKSRYKNYLENTSYSVTEEKGVLRYNKNIQDNYIVDPFINEDYNTQYEFYRKNPDKIFAYMNIPKLSIKKPIYLDASYKHLAMGLAHIDGTALPVGGLSKRSVIAGHRGWYGDLMFFNLHKLDSGDLVQIYRNGKTLNYKVVDKEVIDPSDWEALQPRKGKDILTLLTCDPLAPPRPNRLLVNCQRFEPKEDKEKEVIAEPLKVDKGVLWLNRSIYAITFILVVTFLIALFKLIIYLRRCLRG